MSVHKIPGKENPADLMTKNLAINDVNKHLETLCISVTDDRAEVAPQLDRLNTTEEHHDNRDGDRWIDDVDEVVRVHRRPRMELFTPLRVRGAPPAKSLTPVRVTEGRFCDTGELFKVTDTWTARATAHRSLGRRWTGSTRFLSRTSSTS